MVCLHVMACLINGHVVDLDVVHGSDEVLHCLGDSNHRRVSVAAQVQE
jgi:hypothetical protein